MRKSYAGFLLIVAGILALAWAGYAQSPLTTDDFNQFSWRWIGPVTFSGRITEFAVPRGQTTTYYVLTASGGLWKTEDSGTHFEPIFDKYGNMSMGYLAIAPSNPNILYLGTGEPMHARSSTHGNGMWKSTDAGKTWTKIGLEKSYFIPKVAVDLKNPDIVYVAAEGKLYDNEMDCERGLYKSTDGGKTWTNVFPLKDRGVADFVIDPRNSDVVIAAAYKTFRRAWTYIDRQPGNHLYKTTDGGKTWKKLTNGLPPTSTWAGPAWPSSRKIRTSSTPGSTRKSTSAWPSATAWPISGRPGGFGGGGTGAARLFSRRFHVQPSSRPSRSTPRSPSCAQVHADHGRERGRPGQEAQRIHQDKDFLTKTGVDLAKFNAAARKVYAKNEDLIASINEIDKLLKAEAPKPDSTEAKGRSQVINRHVLEMLYAGALAQPDSRRKERASSTGPTTRARPGRR